MKALTRTGLTMLVCASLLTGCVTQPQKTVAAPQSFNTAVHTAVKQVFDQVKQQELLGTPLGKTVFMLDPVIDANTAEVNKAGEAVEDALREEARKASDKYIFVKLSPENYDSAKYLVSGAILYDALTPGDRKKLYKLALSVVELKTGKVVASSEAWIADPKIDVTPIAAYQDSPMYLKDKRVAGQVETAQMAPGSQAEPTYFNSIPTAALLTKADEAYEARQYEQALSMYKAASLRTDGQLMKTYAGLYQVHRKLNRMGEAEVAFGQLVNIGYQNNNISTKLFFSVASTEFINDPDLRVQYGIWLRQIARLFVKNNACMLIVGHSSRTGSETYNEQLSTRRAAAVQDIMQKDFAGIHQRSRAVGRGWTENIIGTGSDDAQDAIDRRVEFRIRDCAKL
ncbi:MAG TPA: OmpA family protein [Aquabacterium sp.]|uniref:OmpA family protein n=1 Tax=Aquabacterium sp. TaxID=1872578 RepID=UPI002D98193C|nr:OmpA family protein [Aquabacterium sp.]HET6788970.1 OmpA family protein [Aquabacterium sp.]HEX5374444.1 OmpA family protein [Aquabacterium sp.]